MIGAFTMELSLLLTVGESKVRILQFECNWAHLKEDENTKKMTIGALQSIEK